MSVLRSLRSVFFASLRLDFKFPDSISFALAAQNEIKTHVVHGCPIATPVHRVQSSREGNIRAYLMQFTYICL